ncbi:MAG: hypothetical protein ACE15C_21800 [Phycisphaerae bacterium]
MGIESEIQVPSVRVPTVFSIRANFPDRPGPEIGVLVAYPDRDVEWDRKIELYCSGAPLWLTQWAAATGIPVKQIAHGDMASARMTPADDRGRSLLVPGLWAPCRNMSEAVKLSNDKKVNVLVLDAGWFGDASGPVEVRPSRMGGLGEVAKQRWPKPLTFAEHRKPWPGIANRREWISAEDGLPLAERIWLAEKDDKSTPVILSYMGPRQVTIVDLRGTTSLSEDERQSVERSSGKILILGDDKMLEEWEWLKLDRAKKTMRPGVIWLSDDGLPPSKDGQVRLMMKLTELGVPRRPRTKRRETNEKDDWASHHCRNVGGQPPAARSRGADGDQVAAQLDPTLEDAAVAAWRMTQHIGYGSALSQVESAMLLARLVDTFPRSKEHRGLCEYLTTSYSYIAKSYREKAHDAPAGSARRAEFEASRTRYIGKMNELFRAYAMRYVDCYDKPAERRGSWFSFGGLMDQYIYQLRNYLYRTGADAGQCEAAVKDWSAIFDKYPQSAPHSDFLALCLTGCKDDRAKFLQQLSAMAASHKDPKDIYWERGFPHADGELHRLFGHETSKCGLCQWNQGKVKEPRLPYAGYDAAKDKSKPLYASWKDYCVSQK